MKKHSRIKKKRAAAPSTVPTMTPTRLAPCKPPEVVGAVDEEVADDDDGDTEDGADCDRLPDGDD